MNLSKGTTFMVLAGLMGLLAVYVVNHYISSRTEAVSKPTTTQRVVAAVEIPAGTALSKALVKTVPWPQESIPLTALTDPKVAEGRVNTVAIAAGEPILHTKLAPPGTAAGLGALLTRGKRALSVRVDDVSGVAGFLHPGDHVDVLVEMPLPNAPEEQFSKTILQNIVVLTTGQIWKQVQEDQKPILVNSVTLVLTTDEAELLNLVSNQGRIRLALRNSNDPDPVTSKGVATSSIFGHEKPVQKVDSPKVAKTKERNRSVELIKGLKRSEFDL